MKDWIGLLARLVTGGVWAVAGALTFPDPAGSVRAVRAYDLLPEAVVPTVGHLLPTVEVVLGVTLLLGLVTRAASLLSFLLYAAFVVGIATAWARGLEIDCGCIGGGGARSGAVAAYPWEIARDLGLMALSCWLVVRPATRWSLDRLRGSTKAAARSRAERAAAVLLERERRERRRQLAVAVAVASVLAVLVAVGFVISATKDTTGQASGDVPDGVTGGYEVVVGQRHAPTTITV